MWDKKFERRQTLTYQSEDIKLDSTGQQSIVAAFLCEDAVRLDPPQYNFPSLKAFLEKANVADLTVNTPPTQGTDLVLVDDRRDATGWYDVSGNHHSARNWTSYGSYPPQGENRDFRLFDPATLYRKLQEPVCNILALRAHKYLLTFNRDRRTAQKDGQCITQIVPL